MKVVHWLLFRRHRLRRLRDIRQKLSGLPNHTLAVSWYWERIRDLAVDHERRALNAADPDLRADDLAATAYYKGQVKLMEWLLNGATVSGRPYYPARDPGNRPDHPRG